MFREIYLIWEIPDKRVAAATLFYRHPRRPSQENVSQQSDGMTASATSPRLSIQPSPLWLFSPGCVHSAEKEHHAGGE